jgi:hypothetical protein
MVRTRQAPSRLVALSAGRAARVTFTMHADRTAFTRSDPLTGNIEARIVNPGAILVALGGSPVICR